MLVGSTLANAQKFSVSVEQIALQPNERITRLHIHCTPAAVTSIPRVPMGWHLTIGNDPSGSETTVDGTFLVGAAALEEKDLHKLLVLTALDGAVACDGSLSVTTDFENERTIKLTKNNIVLAPLKSERQKP